VFTLFLLALSTGLGWNLPGVGGVGGVLADWFGRFQPAPDPAASPLTLLIVYELFAVVLGIGGLIWGLQRGLRAAALFGLWGGLEVLLLALMPGRIPSDLLWVVLPLALLAGLGVDTLVHHWHSGNGRLRAGYAVLVVVLWIYLYLMLSRYAALGDRADLALAVIALVAQVLLGLSFGLALGPRIALWTGAATTAVVFLAVTVSAAWSVAYVHPTDPREALLSEPTASGIHDLVDTLRELSWQQTGMPNMLEFTLDAPSDSVLAWYLRGFERAHGLDTLESSYEHEVAPIVVTMSRELPAPLALGGEYAGQDYALRKHWSLHAIDCRLWEPGCGAAFDWLFFRDVAPSPAVVQSATLWRRVEVASDD
jgi:hypothetical protein